MGIRFKCAAEDLIKALDVVSIVPPKPITPSGEMGYLFVVRGPKCYVYSRDTTKVARADFPLEEVEGEGAFIYPSNIQGLRMLEGPMTFETDADSEGNPIIRYRAEGATSQKTSFDHRLLTPFDKEYEAAANERSIPVGLLRVAINNAKDYVLQQKETKAEDHFKTLQVFDGTRDEWVKGNGILYASDGTQAFYFACDAFKDKGLAVHVNHIGSVIAFLARANGKVTFKTGANMTFATDETGSILGWAHHSKSHTKFSYYGTKADKYVIQVEKNLILRSLRHLRSELEKSRDKVKLTWKQGDGGDDKGRFLFEVNDGKSKVEGIPVPVEEVLESPGADLTTFVNIDHLISIFDGLQANSAFFRLCPVEAVGGRKGTVGLRTIEEFWLSEDGKLEIVDKDNPPADAFRCVVTRFVPTKD